MYQDPYERGLASRTLTRRMRRISSRVRLSESVGFRKYPAAYPFAHVLARDNRNSTLDATCNHGPRSDPATKRQDSIRSGSPTSTMTGPQCHSTRVRPLLTLATDDRPAYVCRDCHTRFEGERRTGTKRQPFAAGERAPATAISSVKRDLAALLVTSLALIRASRRCGYAGGSTRHAASPRSDAPSAHSGALRPAGVCV
jgi:hypothetical protein